MGGAGGTGGGSWLLSGPGRLDGASSGPVSSCPLAMACLAALIGGLLPAGRGVASLTAAPSATTSERGISTMAVDPPYAAERRAIRKFRHLASWPENDRPS